ncbi:hypothetical protein [Aliiglaciecola sp. LCG003]|uniref:hypothetical protein n=1 Tax=Aliiglaciecola sp. LCG003 TaxID=3053655 RepID=UPI0025729408|nr:hypothetical protein [Aliiglaciecola sp. LCG003]WJG10541.1 hypothetical protein QR722_05725 [Aliiglaciecola sp. LCG003]
MKFQSLCLLLLLAFLTSCTVKVSSIKQDVDVELEHDAGYLLLGVDSNSDLDSIKIYGADNIRLTREDLRSGTQYILIDLEAGDYHIGNIKLNYFWYIDLEEGYWDFTVRRGEISYIGHLEVKSRSSLWMLQSQSDVELVNRSTEALLFMESQFPTILENRTLNYTGPSSDPFLRLMQEDQQVEVSHE